MLERPLIRINTVNSSKAAEIQHHTTIMNTMNENSSVFAQAALELPPPPQSQARDRHHNPPPRPQQQPQDDAGMDAIATSPRGPCAGPLSISLGGPPHRKDVVARPPHNIHARDLNGDRQQQQQHGHGPRRSFAPISNGTTATDHDDASSSYADAVMNGIHDPMTNLAVHSPGNLRGGQSSALPRIQEQFMPEQQQQQHQHQHQHQHFQIPVQMALPTAMPLGGGGGNGSSLASQTGGEPSSEEGNVSTTDTSNGNGRTSRMSMGSERAMSVDLNGNTARADTPGDMSISSDVMIHDHGQSQQQQQQQQQSQMSNGDSRHGSGIPSSLDPHPNPPTAAADASSPSASAAGATTGMEATIAHEREQAGGGEDDMQLSGASSSRPPAAGTATRRGSSGSGSSSLSKAFLRSPEHALERLSYILGRGSLVMINFSQRNLGYQDAELIQSAILSNPQLSVLKLGYNNLGNIGANLIASAIQRGGGKIGIVGAGCTKRGEGKAFNLESGETKQGDGSTQQQQQQQQRQQQYKHHPSLSVLDLGFNNIGDEGCKFLATMAVSRNPALSTLYLSGNAVRESGALALAEVIAGGTGLTSLHLTANRIGPKGVKGIMRSMAEFDVTMQMAHQDRENRMALEDETQRRRKLLKEEQRKKNGNNNEDAELDSFDMNDDEDAADANEEPDDLARLRGFKCMEELYLGGTSMESTGCLSVSNMLLTNLSLRVICLSDNALNDQDLSLFSQSLSRNRELPLEVLRLSFNKLTCVGVETLMNAIWGSKTLREIKLDNNAIRDRGAQLAAVVLTSVNLEILDMGFNRLTIVGIKALMKSLAENRTLQTLTLSGNVLDTNASKAVSYALAYNKTIRKLYVDHCSLSYAAQRHIAAGIVSNSNLALRVMSGFPLGAISVTLGLPGAMETWSNEQVLKFIRVMWDRYRHENESKVAATEQGALSGASSQSIKSTAGSGAEGVGCSATVNAATGCAKSSGEKAETKTGPSDPATVVAAAKSAFEALGDAGGALLLTEEPQRSIIDSSPMVSSDAVMLEKTPSGTIRVPSLDEYDDDASCQTPKQPNIPLEVSNTHISTGSLCTANGRDCPETPMDPMAKRRNMEWLRLHFRSLNQMTQLPYVYADLMQLYRYFYSPVDNTADGDDQQSTGGGSSVVQHDSMPPPPPAQLGLAFNPGIMPNLPPPKLSGLQRKISYRGLHDVMMIQQQNNMPSPNFSVENSSKRRPVVDLSTQIAKKRPRNTKPRIDYFPRIKAKIDKYLSSSKQTKALILLRQLKFVETTMFQSGNPYNDQQSSANLASSTTGSSSSEPIATDAEVILIDML